MARSGNGVTVRIGRAYGGVASTGSRSGNLIENHFRTKIRDRSQTTFIVREAPVVAERISRRVDAELARVGAFIATHLIGRRSIGFDEVEIDVGENDAEGDGAGQVFVDWKALAKSTIGRKRVEYGGAGNQFFKASGALSSEIRSKVGPGLVRLNKGKGSKTKSATSATYNGVSVKLKRLNPDEAKARYHIADLQVEILPGVRTTSLTRAVSGVNGSAMQMTLERRLGLSPGALKKLTGPLAKDGRPIPGHHRPLVQPALQYFLQFRIPRAIEKAVQSTRP